MKKYEIESIEDLIKSSDKTNIYLAYNMLKSDVFKNNNKAKKLIKEISLFDKIRSYSDICIELEIKELTIEDFSFLPENQKLKSLNYHKLQNISLLFNGDWIIDWNNSNQKKWYPYFEYKGSGLGFSGSADDWGTADGMVAFYKDEQISDFCGKTFLDIYREILK